MNAIGRKDFREKLAEVRYNTFEVGWGGGHFGSENLGVQAVAVVDPRPHCEDFASQNQLNNAVYPTVALQGVAGCKLAANCYFPSSLRHEMRAQIPKFFPRCMSAPFSQKVPGINACIYC